MPVSCGDVHPYLLSSTRSTLARFSNSQLLTARAAVQIDLWIAYKFPERVGRAFSTRDSYQEELTAGVKRIISKEPPLIMTSLE